MGTGFSIDTPLRVARYGISSVMSLVDDALIERVRRHHCASAGAPYRPIALHADDSRARRITAWLDLVADLLQRQILELRESGFTPGGEKTKYFELLPDGTPSKRAYLEFLSMPEGHERERAAAVLTESIVAGPADVNIMTKLDRARYGRDGEPLGPELCDAKAALRGFAASRLESSVVLSAGMNPTLFGLLESFPEFYRDSTGRVRKGVILKVSDYRSALVQGKFLAKKGIEVREFRIESGLNCGGHAFATDGELLGPILEDFRDGRESLAQAFESPIRQYYEKRGMPFVGDWRPIRVTVQGGIGTFGEVRRLCEHFGADGTGWASPFLLVEEATLLDRATRQQLANAREEDLYVSDASPLGVPFNNLRGSSSEVWTTKRIDTARPGSGCPRGYLASNTEFSETPICTASHEYQSAKLTAMGLSTPPPSATKDSEVRKVYDKACICNHLGNGALIALGMAAPRAPVAVCPGPNIAYFDREYTLREMVDHLYGRGPGLVPKSRPHMLAKELTMYVDHFLKLVGALPEGDTKASVRAAKFKENLEHGLARYRALVRERPFEGENLDSLARAIDEQSLRIDEAWQPQCPGHRHCASSGTSTPCSYA
jgi:hypothetical protein